MRLLLFPFMLLAGFSVSAQTYAVTAIPAGLLNRTGAVIRNSETVIELKDLDNVIYHTKKAITIMNPSEQAKAALMLNYDKTTTVSWVKGTIYNEYGLPVSKISEKRFVDRSFISNFSLYEDDRVKFFMPAQVNYPYTVEYEYELRSKQSMYFPTWLPVDQMGTSVENSSLQFICPADYNLRHKELNYPGKAEEATSGNVKTYKWEVKNLKSIKDEPYSPDYEEYLTGVKLAPQKFAFKNLKGAFDNWQEYGTWISNNLLKGRDKLSEDTKNYILNLVNNIQHPKEKARKIYEYMQNKTRYISVQIGIGGYQPYPASEVDRLGYGDCKGLVNYMHALLQVAGIESYYTLVYAGNFKRDITTDFVSIQGNHVILCLPFKNDTTWLECTDKFAPFGFLSDFTDDRTVIACTPEGGKIMRTPKLNSEDNRQIRKANFKIEKDGSISGSVNTVFEGSQYDNRIQLINESYTEQLKKLPEFYPLPNLQIASLKFRQEKGAKPSTNEDLEITSYGYCSLNNGNLLLSLNRLNKSSGAPKEVRNRANPVFINRGYYDEDLIVYELPAGFKANAAPEKRSVETPFGQYSFEVTINGNKVEYLRKMHLREGRFNAEEYQTLVEFFQKVADLDTIQLEIEKSQS